MKPSHRDLLCEAAGLCREIEVLSTIEPVSGRAMLIRLKLWTILSDPDIIIDTVKEP